jgi:hypothetical protein
MLGGLILVTALVSVGVTAPADGPFWVSIRPVLLRVEPGAIDRSGALGVDVDVKIGRMRAHLGWTALPLAVLARPEWNATSPCNHG